MAIGMWAYRFTADYFIAGAHSTQRGESANSSMKRGNEESNLNLTYLQMYLDSSCADIRLNAKLRKRRSSTHRKTFMQLLLWLRGDQGRWEIDRMESVQNI